MVHLDTESSLSKIEIIGDLSLLCGVKAQKNTEYTAVYPVFFWLSLYLLRRNFFLVGTFLWNADGVDQFIAFLLYLGLCFDTR